MQPQLYWIRRDLRVHDNPALTQALAAGPTMAVYVATPGQWQLHDDAPIKQDFWRRNLVQLQQSLAALGVPLLVFECEFYRDIAPLLERLLTTLRPAGLYFNAEYPLDEQARDAAVTSLCESLGMRVGRCHGQVLLRPGSVLNQSGQPFKVFTPFARKAREVLGSPTASIPQGDATTLACLNALAAKVPGQTSLNDISWPAPDPAWASHWPAGEGEAHARLARFCQHDIADYAANRDFPALDGTSTLSPWLAAGVLSVGECWRQAHAYHDGKGVETWCNELMWREFYQHTVNHFPHVCRHLPWRDDVAHVPWRHDQDEFQRWAEGRTGIPIVDAAMRQLLETGWMHNRLRMISAMFLSKHLLLDWRLGERWFMGHLVDGDFAANNGGWQWSASTGTDAAPYFRIFNPETQSRRFDPEGSFIRRHVPELRELEGDDIHSPGLFRPITYPPPMVDLSFGRQRALAAFKQSA